MGRFRFLKSGGAVLFFLLTACAGPGERVPVSLSYPGAAPLSASEKPGKILVFPFVDARPEPELIGRRVHLFGRIDTFEAAFPLGERMAQLLVRSLRQRGYDAEMAPPAARPEAVTGERVMTGAVQALRVDATSHFGYTQLRGRAVMNIEIRDSKAGLKTALKIENENAPKVVFFQSDVLKETLDELVSDGLKRVLP